MGTDRDGNEKESLDTPIYGVHSGNVDNTKELRIDGYNYEISDHKIRKWIDLYGEIKSDIEEVTAPSVLDRESVGKGFYMVRVKMKSSIPHILPIGGLKLKCTYI